MTTPQKFVEEGRMIIRKLINTEPFHTPEEGAVIIALALQTSVMEEREACMKSVCHYCDLARPLIGNTHTWQVLTSKDKKGKFIYNAVQEECLATAIRQRSSNA